MSKGLDPVNSASYPRRLRLTGSCEHGLHKISDFIDLTEKGMYSA